MLLDTTQLALERSISGAAARNEALAANLANANTPGYQRQDVDVHSALSQALTADSPDDALRRTSFSAVTDPTAIARADGSSVDVDAESAKLAANGLEHQAAVKVAAARVATMRYAMGVA